jgi:hypothetical protein
MVISPSAGEKKIKWGLEVGACRFVRVPVGVCDKMGIFLYVEAVGTMLIR